MSVQFIVGPAGSGKTFYVNSLILKEADADKTGASFFVLVPDQHTFNTQKMLTDMAPRGCVTNIDILSFKRLSLRLLEAAGRVKDIIDDIDKTYLIAAVGAKKVDELNVLSKSIRKIGTQSQIKSLFSEFITYGITPQKLKEMGELPGMGEAFRRKANDLAVIYESFLDRVEGSYYTSESIITAACDVIDENCQLKDSVIVLDGFTGLTPLQYGMIEKLLPIAKKIYITITLGSGETKPRLDKEALFYMSHEYKNTIGRLCDKTFVEIENDVYLTGEMGRFRANAEFDFLEKNLFREDKNEAYPFEPGSITLSKVATPKLEVEYTAARIAKLLREGVKAKEIAVVCADLSQYDYLLGTTLERFNIPAFIDANVAITYNPLVELIGHLRAVVQWNFKRADVLGLLDTGLLLQDREDINLFDNYILASGIKGVKRYRERLSVSPGDFDGEKLSICDGVRESVYKLCQPLLAVKAGEHTVREFATVLYESIDSLGVSKTLKTMSEKLRGEGLSREAALYDGIYKVFIELLDKMVSTLGNEKMSQKDFFEILMSGLAQTKLGIIPQGSDEVMVGDLERSRLDNRTNIFFLGASDANIPRSGEAGGLLSQLERMKLLESGCALADTEQMKQFSQRFYLYLALTKADKRVFISYPLIDSDKKKAEASYLINEIRRIFPALAEDEIYHLPQEYVFYSVGTMRSRMLEILHDYKLHGSLTDEDAQLLRKLMSYEKKHDEKYLERTLSLFFGEKKRVSSSDLYTGSGFGSISQFETYFECPFHYFSQYMLHLRERELAMLSAIDTGDLSHAVMQLFFEAIKKDEKDLSRLSSEEVNSYFEKAFDEALGQVKNAYIFGRPIESVLLENLKETIRLSVFGMVRIVKEGAYTPKYFEKSFNITGDLPLHVKIDRADEMVFEDKKYLRIVDYKSSSKDIDLTKLFYGLSMQLPLYLRSALSEENEDILPGAMVYYQIKDQKADKEKSFEEFAEDYKIKGLVLDEPEAVAKATLGEKNKNVTRGSEPTISLSDFNAVMDYAYDKSKEAMAFIKAGEFTPAPCKHSGFESCEYCPYISVCGFNAGSGDAYKKLDEKTMDDIRGDKGGI